ncbi:MAG: protein-export chaperone SecB [Proteobacteria bacterium]|nr:protein-export chaperone SecB [Pseudomonadota bacterium]
MSEAPRGNTPADSAPAAGAANGDGTPSIVVNAQYVKDMSFEAPSAPQVFALMQKQAPAIDVDINVRARGMGENTYEVVIHVKSQCKVGDQVGFIVELEYAGLFTLQIPQEHLQAVLLIECPRLLFPYVRYMISDLTRDGGFPPLLLGPVDFVQMYRKQMSPEHQTGGPNQKPAGNA